MYEWADDNQPPAAVRADCLGSSLPETTLSPGGHQTERKPPDLLVMKKVKDILSSIRPGWGRWPFPSARPGETQQSAVSSSGLPKMRERWTRCRVLQRAMEVVKGLEPCVRRRRESWLLNPEKRRFRRILPVCVNTQLACGRSEEEARQLFLVVSAERTSSSRQIGIRNSL